MNSIDLPHAVRPGPYVPLDTAPKGSPREEAITAATIMISSLQQCIFWLVRQGIYVIGFEGKTSNGMDQVIVKVAPSPYLHRLFAGQCAWRARQQKGVVTIYTWCADRFGIRIEWEETCA